MREALPLLARRLREPRLERPATLRPISGVTGPVELPIAFQPCAGGIMRVTVDTQTCDHHGQCMIACPEVFNLVTPDTLEYVADPDESLRACVEEAEAACPTLSIMIED